MVEMYVCKIVRERIKEMHMNMIIITENISNLFQIISSYHFQNLLYLGTLKDKNTAMHVFLLTERGTITGNTQVSFTIKLACLGTFQNFVS